MKQLIVPIAIIVALIAVFVIIDRKEFSRHDDVQTVQSGNSTNKPTVSVPETKPVTELKPVVETKPIADTPVTEAKPVTDPKPATETNQKTDAKPAETKHVVETKPAEEKPVETKPVAETKTVTEATPVTETKPVETKPADTKPVAQTKPEEKLLPAAVPVVTAEETEEYNKLALDFSKKLEEEKMKAEERKKQLFAKAKCIHNEGFKNYSHIGDFMTGKADSLVVAKDYNLSDFRKRLLPSSWHDIDLSTLPQETSFGKDSDGFHITSPKDLIRFHGLYTMLNGMNSSFFFEAVVKNNSSNSDCRVNLGIQCSGNKNSGYMTIQSVNIPANETTVLKWDTNPYEQFIQLRPTISFLGDITIKEFRIYQYVHPEITVVEGTIKDRSQLPDPRTTDYPDCSYTAHFVGNAIFEGTPCNKEVELTVDGFLDKIIQGSNNLKKGDDLKCAIVRFDEVPDVKSSGTQVADDLSLFDLDSYYLISYQKISRFSDPKENLADIIEFADSDQTKIKYVSIYKNVFNAEMDGEAKQAQKDRIQSDLEYINEMIAPYTAESIQELNKKFQDAWTKEKQKDPQGYNRIKSYVWRNVDDSFYALPEQYTFIGAKTNPISQQNIDALVAFKEYLELQGIQLIISLVPNYYAIAARVINKDFTTVPDFGTAYAAKQLLENGIETIYASSEIIRNYNRYSVSYLYPDNGHPADLPQDILSDIVAERICRFHFSRNLDANDFSLDIGDYGPGYWGSMAYPPNCDIGNNPVNGHYKYTKISYQGKEPVNNPNSPIILLGNSYSYSPTNQTMMSFLAMKTGLEIYQISIGSLGPFTTGIQRIFNNPEHYLKGKKVVVFQMGIGHFLSNASILNIKNLDNSMIVSRNGNLVKTIDLPSNDLIVPEFARGLSNPTIYRTGSDNKTTVYETNNLLENFEDKSLSSKGKFFIEINYCCQETDKLSVAINSNKYHLNGGNYTFLWMKEVLPISIESNALKIEVYGSSGKSIAIGSIKIYQMDE